MRLQAEGAPDPLHRADREATVARHAARAPVRRVLRLALQRAGDDRFDARIVDRAWRTGARFVAQSLDPLVKKAAAPLAERHGMHAKLAADRLVLQPLGTRQDDPRALGQCLCGLRPGRQRRQFRALSVRQHQCFQPSSRHVCLPPQWQKASQVAPNQTKCRGRSPDMTNFWFRTLVSEKDDVMADIITRVYGSYETARAAVAELKLHRFTDSEITVVSSQDARAGGTSPDFNTLVNTIAVG